jgi:hypothetical protein
MAAAQFRSFYIEALYNPLFKHNGKNQDLLRQDVLLQ